MITSNYNLTKAIQFILIDALMLVMVYFIPAASHLVPFPLYILDPMRIVLFLSLIFSRNIPNTLIIAATIPLFSSLSTGHPILAKSMIICCELVANILLMVFLFNKTSWHKLPVFFLSLIGSKVFYYIVKYIFIKLNIINVELVSTPLLLQFYTAIGFAVVFYFVISESIFEGVNNK
jgi:hypothetical protein